MVYIAPDGSIHQNPPWNIQRLLGVLWGIVAFIVYFFKTLVGLEGNANSRYRSGGGRSGGSGGPGGGPPRGPRTLKDIKTIDDCSMPGGG